MHMTPKVYFEEKKEEMIRLIKESKSLVKKFESTTISQLGATSINRKHIKKFLARCNIFQATLFSHLEDESLALKYIQKAIARIQDNENKTKG